MSGVYSNVIKTLPVPFIENQNPSELSHAGTSHVGRRRNS